MLGERKNIRVDRFDYVATAYGSRERKVIESMYLYGLVKKSGKKLFDGVSVTEVQDVTIAFYEADVKELSVNDRLTFDGLTYTVNAITRERFYTYATCTADRRV